MPVGQEIFCDDDDAEFLYFVVSGDLYYTVMLENDGDDSSTGFAGSVSAAPLTPVQMTPKSINVPSLARGATLQLEQLAAGGTDHSSTFAVSAHEWLAEPALWFEWKHC